jgi:hypothetical protein
MATLFHIDFDVPNSIPFTSIRSVLSNADMVLLLRLTNDFSTFLQTPKIDLNRISHESIFSTFIKIVMIRLQLSFQRQMEAPLIVGGPRSYNGRPISLVNQNVEIMVNTVNRSIPLINIFKSYFGYKNPTNPNTDFPGTMVNASTDLDVIQQECIHLRNIDSALIGGISRRSTAIPGIYSTISLLSKTPNYRVNQTPIYGFETGPNFHLRRYPGVTNENTVFGCITKLGWDYIGDFRYIYSNILSNTYYGSGAGSIYNFGMGYILSPSNTGCAMNICAFLELFTPEFLQYIIRHHPDFFTGQNGTSENMLCKCFSLINAFNSSPPPTTNNRLFLYSYVVDTSQFTRRAVDLDGTPIIAPPPSPPVRTVPHHTATGLRTFYLGNDNGSHFIVNPGTSLLADAFLPPAPHAAPAPPVHVLDSVIAEIHTLAQQTVNK